MKTKIDNKEELAMAIDQYGDAMAAVAESKAEADVLKRMIETFADKHGVNRMPTERYVLTMTMRKSSLRPKAGVSEENIVANLKRSEIGKSYLKQTYDSSKLKSDFSDSEDGIKQLEEYGFFFTKAEKHAEVKARK